MNIKISHKTVYRYDSQVPFALQQVRLEPQSCRGQDVKHWTVSAEGGQEEVRFFDQHRNRVTLLSLNEGGEELIISSEGEVVTQDNNGILGPHSSHIPLWFFKRSTPLTTAGPLISDLADEARKTNKTDIDLLHGLSALIRDKVTYKLGHTCAATDAEAALTLGNGVCQDHTHIFLAAIRQLGFPARYISGYLMMADTDMQDASHAWAEIHVPDLGWMGIDISNGISPDDKYIRIATGLDYKDAAPVSGIRYGGAAESMSVQIQVQQ